MNIKVAAFTVSEKSNYTCYPLGYHAEMEWFLFCFVYLIVCLCITSHQQLRSYADGAFSYTDSINILVGLPQNDHG